MWVTQDADCKVDHSCTTETFSAPSLRAEQQTLADDIKTLTQRFQIRERKTKVERLHSVEYHLKTPTPQLHEQAECETSSVPVLAQRNGNNVLLYMTRKDNCEVCDEPMLMIMGEAVLSCPQCGRSKDYLDATSASTAYGEEVEFSSFSYKRSNHFQEWLNSFQAKETTDIPQRIFDRVMEELYRQRISDPASITTKKIREVLKDLKLRKYYEHVTQITCRLNGKCPPRMTPEQEEQCRLMFMAIQGPFEKHCPADRKNFLSYSYCLYKFCELMAYDEFLPCFALLKGRDKLFKQDSIFKKICEELHWEFLPSI
jgi:hypothetical protein